MAYKVRYTTRFKIDLYNIEAYLAGKLFNPTASVRIKHSINKLKENISINPEMHPVVIIRDSQKIRRCPIDNYVVLYYFEESDSSVVLVGMPFGASNYQAALENRSR